MTPVSVCFLLLSAMFPGIFSGNRSSVATGQLGTLKTNSVQFRWIADMILEIDAVPGKFRQHHGERNHFVIVEVCLVFGCCCCFGLRRVFSISFSGTG